MTLICIETWKPVGPGMSDPAKRLEPLPESHEGEPQEEPQGAPKLCHQGGKRVDQLLLGKPGVA